MKDSVAVVSFGILPNGIVHGLILLMLEFHGYDRQTVHSSMISRFPVNHHSDQQIF